MGAGFVLEALFVGARCLYVSESVYHLSWGIDLLQLDFVDTDPSSIGIEHILHQFVHRLFRLLPLAGQKRLDVRLADNVAHGAFGHLFHGDVGPLNVEEIILSVLDAPEDNEINVDDVLVACERETFLWHRSHAPYHLAGSHADLGDEEDSHLGDFIEDHNAVLPIDAAIQSNLRETTTRVLGSLTPREERVLRMRFGIGMNTDHTLEEVGQQFSVTRERVRQIEALRKLKHPSRSRQLHSFLDH